MGDEAVLRGIRDRDGETIGWLMDKYARLLWPIAEAVLMNIGSEQDVEECVADAFIHLWEHPEKYDPQRGKLRSYLCMTVRCRAIDRYRELMRRSALPLEEAAAVQSAGIQEQLLNAQTRRELVAAVNALGEPEREILVRRYCHDQKPKQIALALGMTVKQVDNSLYRTKRFLRQKLEEKEAVL